MPHAPLGRHNMASALEPHLHLTVGHILFLDIVEYSKLLADEQKELIQELNRIDALGDSDHAIRRFESVCRLHHKLVATVFLSKGTQLR